MAARRWLALLAGRPAPRRTRRAISRRRVMRLRAARPGHLHAAPHHARRPTAQVLDRRRPAARLSRFTRERITLLGFIYTTLHRPRGCPLAYRVFDALKRRGRAPARACATSVRLVTLSLRSRARLAGGDAALRGQPRRGRRAGDSLVLSHHPLGARAAALVDGFGQDVRRRGGRARATPRASFRHVLKVFLIDPRGVVREIYTSTFLFPDVVLNDIETLRRE